MMIRQAAVRRTRCISFFLCGASYLGGASCSGPPSRLYPAGYSQRPWILHVDRGHFVACEGGEVAPPTNKNEDDASLATVPMLVTTGWVPIGEVEQFERAHWQTVGTTLVIVMPDAGELKPGTEIRQILELCTARGIFCWPVWPAQSGGSAELMELILNAAPPHPHDVGVGAGSRPIGSGG